MAWPVCPRPSSWAATAGRWRSLGVHGNGRVQQRGASSTSCWRSQHHPRMAGDTGVEGLSCVLSTCQVLKTRAYPRHDDQPGKLGAIATRKLARVADQLTAGETAATGARVATRCLPDT